MMTKMVDKKGRITLGNEFAGQQMIIEIDEAGRVVLTPAVVVPQAESWLYKNETALNSLRQGLSEASQAKFSKSPPDLANDALLVAQLED